MVVWVLMTGEYEQAWIRSIHADPLNALNEVEGEWWELRDGEYVNNDYIESAEVFGVEVVE